MSDVRHVFVYGSLRPDDDSGQSRTMPTVDGMTAQWARLPRAKLFRDQYKYACAVLDPSYKNEDCVMGYALSVTDESLFQEKLALFDQIEGYRGQYLPNLYQRTVADVELISDEKSPAGRVPAYIYHGTHRCNRKNQIPSGDWLQRDRD